MIGNPVLRILFVCHGSTEQGLGHVMRSRTVAHAMARSSAVRMAVIGDHYVDSLLDRRGLKYDIVENESAIVSILESFAPQIVVFDLLSYAQEPFREIRNKYFTVSLSPVFDRLNEVHLLFSRTVYRGHDWDFSTTDGPEQLCGLDYTVLRENCVRIPTEIYKKNVAKNPLSVVVSMGGGDAGNKTQQVLNSLRTIPSRLLVWVLLGEGYTHSYEGLVQAISDDRRHEILLAKTNDSMWRIMESCSVAVLAGGTVTYEAVYAGLPSINLFENAGHQFLVREVEEQGAVLSAGYPFDDALSVMCANLIDFERDRDQLVAMHEACLDLVDDQGASRISRAIFDRYQRRCTSSAELIQTVQV